MNQNRRAIVTTSVGELFEQMGRITHPLMIEYSQRCNADFVAITERMMGHLGPPMYEKFQLYRLLDVYDRLIFVDSDILVSRDSPNLFDVVPRDHFGAASETYSQASIHRRITQEELGLIDWHRPYFNSGMMVISRAHKSMFDPTYGKLLHWVSGDVRRRHNHQGNDQPYFNYRLNELQIPFMDVGYRFNHTCVIRKTHYRFRSHLIHHSGVGGHRYGSKIDQIRKDARVLSSPFLLWLSRRVPIYRWVADRMTWAFLDYLRTERFARTKT